MCASVSDQLSGRQAFVATEIVGDDNVAGGECRGEALLDPGGEHLAIDRPIQNEGSDDAIVAQAGQKGQGLPMPVRDVGGQSLALRGPAAGPGHVGLDPGLIRCPTGDCEAICREGMKIRRLGSSRC